MMAVFWSAVLQWGRVGIGALVFLLAARWLSLEELGLFASAFAPIRLFQGIYRTGFVDAAVVADKEHLAGLHRQAFLTGAGLSAVFASAGVLLDRSLGPLLLALAPIPLVVSIGAVAEGQIRRDFGMRMLAQRTFAAHGTAGIIAIGLLMSGAGIWALVTFTWVHSALASYLASRGASKVTACHSVGSHRNWRLPLEIGSREILAGAAIPLCQMLFAATLGFEAAGAFQIAARLMTLIDGLAIAPLRYLALPALRTTEPGSIEIAKIQRTAAQTATIAFWLWPSAAFIAPEVLRAISGAAATPEVAQVFLALAPLGLVTALVMPLTQALTAYGYVRLTVRRSAIATLIGLCVTSMFIPLGATAAAAGLSAGFIGVFLVFLRHIQSEIFPGFSYWSAMKFPLFAALSAIVLVLMMGVYLKFTQFLLGTSAYILIMLYVRRRGETPI